MPAPYGTVLNNKNLPPGRSNMLSPLALPGVGCLLNCCKHRCFIGRQFQSLASPRALQHSCLSESLFAWLFFMLLEYSHARAGACTKRVSCPWSGLLHSRRLKCTNPPRTEHAWHAVYLPYLQHYFPYLSYYYNDQAHAPTHGARIQLLCVRVFHTKHLHPHMHMRNVGCK